MQYSFSRLGCFETCPLKYKFQYILKPDIERLKGVEAFMGTQVHDSLEKFYKDRNHGKIASVEELLAYYNDLWVKRVSDDVVVRKPGLNLDHYRVTGEKCLVDYYNRHKPFNKGKTIATELKVNVDLLGDGNYKFIGYIDRLDTTADGVYEIHDYKTNQRLPTQAEKDEDEQLALYEIALRQMWDDVKEVELIWHFLIFDKEIISRRKDEDLEKLRKRLVSVVDNIQKSTDEDYFPPQETALCGWCDYQEICTVKKHQAKTEKLPVNEWLKEEGVVLANEYARIKDEETGCKKHFEEQLKPLQEALIEYARKEGVEYVYGSEKRVKVSISEGLSFPASGKPERDELEEKLKEKGYWDEVSMLNTRGITKGLTEHTFPKELNEIIEKYGEKQETTTLRISKIKEK